MKRPRIILFTIIMVAALLVACSRPNLSEQKLNFMLAPSHTLGYEVDGSGTITIETRTMTFSNAPGELAAHVNGYQVRYFDGTGTEVAADPVSDSYAVDVLVPGGFTCDEPDPVLGCSTFDPGFRTAQGPAVESPSFGNLLPVSIAQMQLNDPDLDTFTRWYAEFRFFGTRSDGSTFYTRPFRVDLNPPD